MPSWGQKSMWAEMNCSSYISLLNLVRYITGKSIHYFTIYFRQLHSCERTLSFIFQFQCVFGYFSFLSRIRDESDSSSTLLLHAQFRLEWFHCTRLQQDLADSIPFVIVHHLSIQQFSSGMALDGNRVVA
jgi:hypothetical protein